MREGDFSNFVLHVANVGECSLTRCDVYLPRVGMTDAVVQEGLPCWVSGEWCASSHAAVLDASLVALKKLRGCGVLDDRLRVSGRSKLLDELRESRLRRRDALPCMIHSHSICHRRTHLPCHIWQADSIDGAA